MSRQDVGEIYALGWFVVLLTAGLWFDTKFMPIGATYLIAMLPMAIICS